MHDCVTEVGWCGVPTDGVTRLGQPGLLRVTGVPGLTYTTAASHLRSPAESLNDHFHICSLCNPATSTTSPTHSPEPSHSVATQTITHPVGILVIQQLLCPCLLSGIMSSASMASTVVAHSCNVDMHGRCRAIIVCCSCLR